MTRPRPTPLAAPDPAAGAAPAPNAEPALILLDAGRRMVALNPPARRLLASLLPGPLPADAAPPAAALLGRALSALLDQMPPAPDGAAPGGGVGSAGADELAPTRTGRVRLAEPVGLLLDAELVPLAEGGVLLRLTDAAHAIADAARLAQAQRLQALGQMAAVLAHDVANLLGGIGLATDQLAGRLGPAGEIADIRAAIAHGSALTRGLLAFGRQQRLRPRLVAVNQAIRRQAPLLARLLGTRAALRLDLARGVGRARVDPAQLQQILCNLTVNARAAMPGGGTVWVRTGRVEIFRPLSLGVELVAPGDYAMIELADDGVGIPPAVQARMFEPFFTTRAGQGGTGLGLAAVHGAVRQSGGFLGLDSAPGAGMRIRVYLPRIGRVAGRGRPAQPPAVGQAEDFAPDG